MFPHPTMIACVCVYIFWIFFIPAVLNIYYIYHTCSPPWECLLFFSFPFFFSFLSYLHRPLIRAVREGQNEVIKILIDHGANILHTQWNGGNLLHEAAHYGQTESVRYLQHLAPDKLKSLINAQDCAGETPLMIANKKGHNELVELLVSMGASTASWNWRREKEKNEWA